MIADQDQYQGTPEYAFADQAPIESSVTRSKYLVEYDIDPSELVKQIDYSFSLYYKHSWKNPNNMDLGWARWNWQAIGGITRKDRGSVWNYDQLADRTLALFLWPMQHLVGYHFCTYNADNRVSNDCQNIPVTLDEYELGWTWFYFGYNSRRQKAYAVVVTNSGQTEKVYEISWPGRPHFKKNNIPDLRFHIGTPSSAANGRFFDIRLDFGAGSYFGNLEDVLAYKTKFVPNPPVLFAEQKLTDNFLIKEQVASGRTQSTDEA